MKTTLKEIKRFPAIDITTADFDTVKNIARYKHTTIAYSVGTYGVNGIVFNTFDGILYKITARTTALFQVL